MQNPSQPQRTFASIQLDMPAPAHVPKDRVVDLTWATGSKPNDLRDPYEPCGWLAEPGIPRLLFNPPMPNSGGLAGGSKGAWVVAHDEDIERVYTDNEQFSNKGAGGISGAYRRNVSLHSAGGRPAGPREISPSSVFPHFSASRINQMEPQMRASLPR